MEKLTNIRFADYYSDDSGVEFLVEYDSHETCCGADHKGLIKFETCGDVVGFPVGRLDWLLEALHKIQAEHTSPQTQ